MRCWLAIILAALLLCNIHLTKVQAAEGDLDITFGSNGRVTTDIFGFADEARDVAVQADGKIVAVGYTSLSQSAAEIANADFAVVRYNADGALDTSFGSGGKVNTDFSGYLDIAEAVVVQPDNRIVVAGYSLNFSGTAYDFALARYNSDGSLDTGFGTGGKVTTDFNNSPLTNKTDLASDVALARDGKIIVAGHSNVKISNNDVASFSVARYNQDGSLDTSFDGDGKAVTQISRFENLVAAVAVQTNNKIVVTGRVYTDPGYDFGVVRFNVDGTLDEGFGSNGKVNTDFAFSVSYDFPYDVAVQRDGKILVAGQTDGASGGVNIALARYNPDGTLDAGFGAGGKATTNLNRGAVARAIALQRDGKIIAAGQINSGTGFFDFAVARFNHDGSLDSTFGPSGSISTDFFGDMEVANAVAVQPDGKIVAAGFTRTITTFEFYPHNHWDFALARYEGGPPGPIFDFCLQDEREGDFLEVNLSTGDYRFTSCSGFTLDGIGVLDQRGSVVTLRHNASDRRLLVNVNMVVNRGTASIQALAQGARFIITDRDTANNSCRCE